MKKETQTTLAIIGLLIGLGLVIWASFIMRNYEGYLEIMKAARRAAAPQFIIGWILFIISYIFTFRKK